VSTDSDRFYVVTGGPGSGKTSLIKALRSRGYDSTVEAGRAIIRDQIAIDGRALPWRDPLLFAELMLSMDMQSYHLAEQVVGPVFFDRGIPDVLGYLRLMHIPAPEHMRNAARVFPYNHVVSSLRRGVKIFRQDEERKQDFDEAIRAYDAMVETSPTTTNLSKFRVPPSRSVLVSCSAASVSILTSERSGNLCLTS
jgi:predicted ATPase